MGIKILSHKESLDYAEHIEKDWLWDRFKDIKADKYLNLVVLDKEKEEDIVQVSGATATSREFLNAVKDAVSKSIIN